jgi:hypothetical protein
LREPGVWLILLLASFLTIDFLFDILIIATAVANLEKANTAKAAKYKNKEFS